MSQGMKGPRDILVAGIGFLLGMVFCYFVLASKFSRPERGLSTIVYGAWAAETTNGIDLKALELNWN